MAKFELLRSIQQRGETILPGTAERPVYVEISDDEVRELERRGVGKRVREAKAEKAAEGQGSGADNGTGGSGSESGIGQGAAAGKSDGKPASTK